MCEFLVLVHFEYQNIDSMSKVRFLGGENILAAPHNFKCLLYDLKCFDSFRLLIEFGLGLEG